MILTDNVWVQKDSRTYNYYISKGYEFFEVDFSRYSHSLVSTKDLHSKSRASVLCRCNKCGKERTISFHQYREICHKCNNKKPTSNATKIKQSKARIGKQKGSLNPSWKGGKPICECGVQLKNWKGTQCKKCFLERDQTGVSNPAWKNYTTEETTIAKAERKGYLARRWRISVYKMFNGQCDVCLIDTGKMHAHHLMNWLDNPSTRFDADNGVLLCQQCHMDFHSAHGKSNNTKEQYIEYKETYNG